MGPPQQNNVEKEEHNWVKERPGISDKKQEATASIETKVQDDLERAMEKEMVRIRSRNFGEEWQR